MITCTLCRDPLGPADVSAPGTHWAGGRRSQPEDTGAVGEGIVTSTSEAAADVAAIVRHRSEPDFVPMLRQADQHFDGDGAFELTLAQTLRADSALVDLWETWSTDQRWTPSAYFEGTEVGWFDGARRHVQVHPDRASAAADFVHRLAAWLARREIVGSGG